jgi:intraflagellar transport protein 81
MWASCLPREQFNEAFLKADPQAIYPFMAWMLQRLPDLKKRAYLQRFLRPATVPDEFFAEEQIVNLISKIKVAQEVFKELHKALERSRTTHHHPGELESDIRQLDQETEMLDAKLAKLREKVDTAVEYKTVNFDEVLQATNMLRREQEDEASLAKSLREQKMRLERAQHAVRQANAKLKELEESAQSHADPKVSVFD